ncbi:hypothetical protein CFP65_6515 [Kitasatospora sp. MMS16-BH015]|uniref:hypothetical protein n=1 Tax=Kitasatospora sp. MMS16-BH015 TaxID=2018025 RepID=UPI000CA0A744|nr:hypothetical protein [Kitasatospora sp. MMS16-BH015]AUG81168.1 hypothetical protein CFP65_6515 [Kitasatospora sp. MMS16-BH015]
MSSEENIEPRGERRWWLLPTLVALALLATGGYLVRQAGQAEDAADANRALTDSRATTEVIGDVGNALGRIFSYTPADADGTAKAAGQLLDGRAAQQYQTLFAQVRPQVKDQQLTLTSRVVRAGVTQLARDQAELLVFLDQSSQRAGKPATSAAAQLSVTARREGGHWRITELKNR